MKPNCTGVFTGGETGSPSAAGTQLTMTMSSTLGTAVGSCCEGGISCGEAQFGSEEIGFSRGNEVRVAPPDDSFLNCTGPFVSPPLNNCEARDEPSRFFLSIRGCEIKPGF